MSKILIATAVLLTASYVSSENQVEASHRSCRTGRTRMRSASRREKKRRHLHNVHRHPCSKGMRKKREIVAVAKTKVQ